MQDGVPAQRSWHWPSSKTPGMASRKLSSATQASSLLQVQLGGPLTQPWQEVWLEVAENKTQPRCRSGLSSLVQVKAEQLSRSAHRPWHRYGLPIGCCISMMSGDSHVVFSSRQVPWTHPRHRKNKKDNLAIILLLPGTIISEDLSSIHFQP